VAQLRNKVVNSGLCLQTALAVLLCCSVAMAQAPADPAASQSAPAVSSDMALSDTLAQLQSLAERSDADMARLRIEKWKTDSAGKDQAVGNAGAIRRNLANAVPELLRQVRSAPGSLATNFKLYHDLNILYEALFTLVESAGAFGPKDQYTPLAADAAELDKLRHQFADRLDRITGSSDADIAQLRSRLANAKPAVASAPCRIVVDDNKPVARKKPKPKRPATQPSAQPQTQKPSPQQ
jgi:hypothetical protein